MIRAMIVTNMKKGFSKREVGKYLQNIQRIAGMHNICISKAIIDHSEGVEPFVSDALDMIENVICTADCNAIILDDTFGYDITDSYAALKELADICNTPIYHYKGGTMRMSDVNNDFDYDSEPFEVLEMQLNDEHLNSDVSEDTLKNVREICEAFEEKVKYMSACVKRDDVLCFAESLMEVASFYVDLVKVLDREMQEEINKVFMKRKKK